MIIGERKPVKEILQLIGDRKKILVLGCGTCVTVCLSGGEKEAKELASLLRIKKYQASDYTVERQCEPEFIRPLDYRLKEVEAVLSLACGVGVQALADRYPRTPVFP
ncbi:MAG: hypothetical protein WCP87_06225, partial [Atribacterota bacterium]